MGYLLMLINGNAVITTTTISIIRELKGIGGKSGKIPRLGRQMIPVVIGSLGLPFQECSSCAL